MNSIFNKLVFGAILRQTVEKTTLSINEFSRQAGISASYISRLIRGKVNSPPSPQVLARLARNNEQVYLRMLVAVGYLPEDIFLWQVMRFEYFYSK